MDEIAQKYGSALFSISKESNDISSFQDEVKTIKSILLENQDFVKVLSSNFLTMEERIEMIDKTFIGVRKEIISLLKILVEKNRMNLIFKVFKEFNSLCNQEFGVIEGLLITSVPLNKEIITKIEKKISEKENKKVELIVKVDPSIIGGVKVSINNHVYDGSIINQIESMKAKLLSKEPKV